MDQAVLDLASVVVPGALIVVALLALLALLADDMSRGSPW